MSPCSQIEDYLIGKLKGKSLAEFQTHLGRCSQCTTQVSEWNNLEGRIQDWSTQLELPKPSPAEAASLVVSLRPRRAPPRWRRPAIYVGLSAAAALLVFIFLPYYQEPKPSKVKETIQATKTAASSDETNAQSPIQVLYSEEGELSASGRSFARRLSVPGEGRLLLGLERDRIGLSAQTEIEILRADSNATHIRLFSGSLAVEVEPHQSRGSFVVEAAGYTVKVVGTRFGVSMSDGSEVYVTVDRGQVVVIGPEKTLHKVHKNQTLELGKEGTWRSTSLMEKDRQKLNELLSDEKMAARGDEVEDADATSRKSASHNKNVKRIPQEEPELIGDPTIWREWILGGQYNKAEQSLIKHLETTPNDAGGWSLLANCRRKAGKWGGALKAYHRVIEYGGPRAANSARFEAAVLLQDKFNRYAAAGPLLNEYLKGPLLLESEAMIRLARSRLHTGQKAAAKELFEQVLERHRGTSAAIQASRLLKSLDESQ